jgi:hypothetical protein
VSAETGSGPWLERYRRGDRELVWHELRQLGDRVREPDLAGDAQAVCDEMAGRARHNIELVVGRLREQGYRFHVNDNEQTPVEPFLPPSDEATSLASWMEERFGPIPMTISSWLRIVGDVGLVGTHPSWVGSSGADPLVLEIEGNRYPGTSMREFFDEEFEQWQEWAAEDDEAGGFVLPVAPDRLHKANISGGEPYGVRLPDATAEGLFVAEVAMPLVAYLNWVFRNGGFPGPATGDEQWRVKQSLSSGLLAL